MKNIQVFALNPDFSPIRRIILNFLHVFVRPGKNSASVPSMPLTGSALESGGGACGFLWKKTKPKIPKTKIFGMDR
jgi:hypothetical protein